MRHLCALLLMLLICGCREKPSADGQISGSVAKATKGEPAVMTILLSGTESDPWSSEMLAAIGAQLEFNPQETRGSSGHIDVYGPYELSFADRPVTLHIGMAGFSALAALETLQELGAEAQQWVRDTKPDMVWLDGDQAQFAVGREIVGEFPILFSGVAADRQAYYPDGSEVTGVYRRHSLPRVLDEIWKLEPEAQRFALVADDSPSSRATVAKFKELFDIVLKGEQETVVAEPVKSWSQLRGQLKEYAGSADAIIVCGIGGEFSGEELQTQPAPEGILTGIDVPVVALGPTAIDNSGATVATLRPSAHAAKALESAALILKGGNALAIPTATPDEMGIYSREAVAP